MEQRIAANYAASLEKCLEGLGVSHFLQRSEFDISRLQDPESFISMEEFSILIRSAFHLTHCPWLGLTFGKSLSIVNHGFLGYAAMSSPTMGTAIHTMLRYINTRTSVLRMQMYTRNELVCVELDVLWDTPDIQRFFVEMAVVHLLNMRGFLIQTKEPCPLIQIAYAPPDYAMKYREFLNTGAIEFEADSHRVWFATKELDYPISFADDSSYQLAKSQLQAIVTQLSTKADLASRIKTILINNDLQYLSMEEIARQVCMSSRTMRRHLQKENLTYQELVDEVRFEKAKAYLLHQRMTQGEISFLLGFQDVSNFVKAFKRWTGMTPGEYRERL